jgi:hypothetical protein
MYAQIRTGRNRELKRIVYNLDTQRFIDCTWCCDVSISEDAAVNDLLDSKKLLEYDSLLLMPLTDDDGNRYYFTVNEDPSFLSSLVSELFQIEFQTYMIIV